MLTLRQTTWTQLVAVAWQVNPHMACMLPQRFKHSAVSAELQRLVLSDPFTASRCPEALDVYLKHATPGSVGAVRPLAFSLCLASHRTYSPGSLILGQCFSSTDPPASTAATQHQRAAHTVCCQGTGAASGGSRLLLYPTGRAGFAI